MHRFISRGLSACAIAFIIACATTTTPTDPFSDPTPRAQGTIILAASHSPGASAISPSVSVSFIPDTSAISQCGVTQNGTCEITQAPDCTSLKCGLGETCGWDTSCSAACVKACTKTCGPDQKCSIDSGGTMSCVAIQSFDSGPIAFSGTAMPISVYPPYSWKASGEGSPFAPGASLHVTAEGPTGAGFIQFDQNFTATTLLEANPSLDHLQLSDVFGDSDLEVGWVPGNDSIFVTASGLGGSARCVAVDRQGGYGIPRDVLTTVIGTLPDNTPGTSVQLAIQRYRLDRHHDAQTIGSLDSQTVQTVAWLDLVTTSTESIALQSCKSTQTACGAKCVDTSSDPNNCGDCGNSCNGGSCVQGACQTSSNSCSSCQSSAKSSTCNFEWSSCTGDCSLLATCVNGCNGNTSCAQSCTSNYPNGVSAFDSYWSCICTNACSSECLTACGG